MPDTVKPIHQSADQGYTKSADTYVQGRPDYPPQIMTWLTTTLDMRAGSRVTDLGAGTGKFTRYLQRTGADITAVEPVASMREQLSSQVQGITVVAGTAENMPLQDASVDIVVCAQAFHWFATEAALDEIHRVLRPGGRLALVWNKRDTQSAWVRELDAIVNAYEADTPRFHTGQWRQAFPHRGFSSLQEQRFPHGHTGTPENVIINRTLSTSFIAALPENEKRKVRNQVLSVIENSPELKNQSQVTFPYETLAYWTVRQN